MESKTKSAVYLPIQSNHAQSETSLKIKMNYGYAGYGIYIELLQRLTAEPTRTLSLDNLKALAYGMHISVDELQPIVNDFFTTKGNIFFSEYLNESLMYFDEKYNKSVEKGKTTQSKYTPEERSANSKALADKRWNKNDNASYASTDNKVCELTGIDIRVELTPDANNKKEKNRIEENRTKQNKTETEEKKKEENKTQTEKFISNYFIGEEANNFLLSNYNEFIINSPIDFNKFDSLFAMSVLFINDANDIKINNNQELTNNIKLTEGIYTYIPNLINAIRDKEEIKNIYVDYCNKFKLVK